MSSIPIKIWLLSFFVPLPMICLSPSMSMVKPVINMLTALIGWMTRVIFNSHFYCRCCKSMRPLTLWACQNVLQSLVRIGVLGYALIPVLSGANMGFVLNAEESTKHKTMKCASLLLKFAMERDLAQAMQKAEVAILEGPKPFLKTQ